MPPAALLQICCLITFSHALCDERGAEILVKFEKRLNTLRKNRLFPPFVETSAVIIKAEIEASRVACLAVIHIIHQILVH